MRPPSEHTRGQNHSFYLFAYLFQPQRSRDQYYKCSTVSILTHAIVAVMESPMLMGSPSNQQEVSIFQLQLDVFDSICQTAYCWLRVGFTQVKAIRVVVGFKKYLSPFIASDQNVLFSFLPNADYLIQCLMIQRSRNSVKHQIKARFYSAMLVTVTIITVTWCSIHSVTLDAGFTRKEHAVQTQITLSINPPYESIYGLVGSR